MMGMELSNPIGVVLAASSSVATISDMPTWAYAIIIGVMSVIALSLCVVSVMNLDGGARFGVPAVFCAVAAFLCFAFISFANAGVSSSNASRIGRYYGISKVDVVQSSRRDGTFSERVSLTPSPSSTSGVLSVKDGGDFSVSKDMVVRHVTFRDSKGTQRDGYVAIKGNRATLYITGAGASGSSVVTASAYAKSSAEGGGMASTVYDYGNHG